MPNIKKKIEILLLIGVCETTTPNSALKVTAPSSPQNRTESPSCDSEILKITSQLDREQAQQIIQHSQHNQQVDHMSLRGINHKLPFSAGRLKRKPV